ncbi:MAG TPA: universal stress protein [Polyangiaceae bacterium]|nr:universal stress protein [Polyangiaceae bacterium]
MTSKHNIVVGYDTSELAGRALEAAIAHAASLAPATVHVVRALALMPGVDEDQGAANAQLARLDYQAEALRETVERQTLPVGVTLVTHVNVGEPATILAEVARAADADFVFVGTHGRTGLARAFFGSIAERTVRLAPCSVVVVRPKESDTAPHIEPACERCAEVRQASHGKIEWCQQHSKHASHHPSVLPVAPPRQKL